MFMEECLWHKEKRKNTKLDVTRQPWLKQAFWSLDEKEKEWVDWSNSGAAGPLMSMHCHPEWNDVLRNVLMLTSTGSSLWRRVFSWWEYRLYYQSFWKRVSLGPEMRNQRSSFGQGWRWTVLPDWIPRSYDALNVFGRAREPALAWEVWWAALSR